jgi:hypothetical protein
LEKDKRMAGTLVVGSEQEDCLASCIDHATWEKQFHGWRTMVVWRMLMI